VKLAFKIVLVGMCASCLTLVAACGSTPGAPSQSGPPPAEATPQQQAADYFTALAPALKLDKALSKKTSRLTRMEFQDLDDAYSVAAAIKGSFLPDVKRIQEMLATIKPPPQFRVAHVRLRRAWALGYDFLSFASDSLERVVFTRALDPGFTAKGDRYMARIRKASRRYNRALRAGARSAHVKLPKRLLLETSP
jgi:hypothetical protein